MAFPDVALLVVAFLGLLGSARGACTSGKRAEIFDVSPKIGSRGTLVNVTGCGLTNVAAVQIFNSLKPFKYTTFLVRTDQLLRFEISRDSAFGSASNAKVEIRDASDQLLDETAASFWTWIDNMNVQFTDVSGGQSGTRIRISGCLTLSSGGRQCGGGTRVTAVTIGNIPAKIINQNLSSSILQYVTVEAGYSSVPLPSEIIVRADSGAYASFQFWNYRLPGSVTSVDPSSGQRGTRVTIRGRSLLGVGSDGSTISGGKDDVERVTLAETEADVISVRTDQIIVSARTGPASTGDVVIVTKSGPYVVSRTPTQWTQLDDGFITDVIPSAGQAGAQVALCGKNLSNSNANISTLTLAGIKLNQPVASQSRNASCIIISVPPPLLSGGLPPPSGPIQLVHSTGAIIDSQSGVTFFYAAVDSLVPTSGRHGTYVTITGSRLDLNTGGTDAVLLGGYPATILSSNSTLIRARVGPGPNFASALGSVTLTGKGGTALKGEVRLDIIKTGAWQYIAPGRVTDVNPAQGQVGTRVTINGVSLIGLGTSVKSVFLGGLEATVVSSTNASVVVEAPDGAITGREVKITVESDTGAFTENATGWKYLEKGTIFSVSPSRGQLGTIVVIKGRNLLGYGSSLSSVTLLGIPVQKIRKQNDSYVEVEAGEYLTSDLGSVELTSSNGAKVSSPSGWSYIVPGVITTLSPNQGQVGTEVTVSGTNLFGGGIGAKSVTFSGIPVEKVLSSTSTKIVVKLGRSLSSGSPGDVVITSDTGATVIRRNGWTYRPEGVITNISPRSGQFGTTVTLTGTELLGYGTKIIGGTVAGVDILSVETQTASLVKLRVGSGTFNATGIVILTSDTKATISSSQTFTYAQSSVINEVTPQTGFEGTAVFIRGSNFRAGGKYVASVSLDGVPVTTIFYDSDTEVVVQAGPSSAASPVAGRVELVSESGAITRRESSFSYNRPQAIGNIAPTSGQQGTRVTVDLPFDAGTVRKVTVDETAANIVSRSGQSVVVTLGRPSRQGSFVGDVAVEASGGIVTRAMRAFTYVSEGVIFDVRPKEGQYGTRVTVTGENFLGGGSKIESATFAGLTSRVVNYTSTSVEVVITGKSIVETTDDVALTSDTGSMTRKLLAWKALVVGLISSVTPAIGQIGTVVTIQGARLLGGGKTIVAVYLSGIKVDRIVSYSDTVVSVIAGDGDKNASVIDQTGFARIVSDTGSVVERASAWTYRRRGQLTSVVPREGQRGTLVTLRGTDLLGQGKSVRVLLGQREALNVVSQNESVIIVRSDDGVNITGKAETIRIIADTGAYFEAQSIWTYREPGTISSVYPDGGQTGTEIVIDGTNLLCSGTSISSASVGGTVASVLSADNSRVVIAAGYRSAASGTPVDIRLVANTGADVSLSKAFTYRTPGQIANVEPRAGVEGSRVVISGTELLGYGRTLKSVTLAGVRATVSFFNTSRVEVIAGSSSRQALRGPLIITSSSGAMVTSSIWFYIAPGTISRIDPVAGRRAGEYVTLRGSNLLAGGRTVKEVLINGARSVNASAQSLTEIRVRLGPLPTQPGITGVTVVLDTGATYSNSTRLFRYASGGGSATSVRPSRGYGNEVVTIRGTKLLNGGNVSSVLLAGIYASSIVSANETTVVVVAGSGYDVTGDVVIISSNGLISGLHDGWTYLPLLRANAVSPSRGQNGTLVEIRDSKIVEYYPIENATIAGIAARLVSESVNKTVQSDRNETILIRENVLALEAGPSASPTSAGDIVLRSHLGVDLIIEKAWSYVMQPRIQTVFPRSGYSGTRVTITGVNLLGGGSRAEVVTVAGVETTITSQNIRSPNLYVIVLTVGSLPTSSGSRKGEIVIRADTGATVVERTIDWTYVGVNVTSIRPGVGRLGTRVTIAGFSLLAGGTSISSATLSGSPATVAAGTTNTQIVLVAPQGAPPSSSPGDIILVMNTGARVVLKNRWTFTDAGNITVVTPSTGREGTEVVIKGENLLGGGASASDVYLDGIRALNVIVSSGEYVRVVAGTGPFPLSGAAGGVRIVADTGAEVSRGASFTYEESGQVISVNPNSGQIGTRVVIKGKFFVEKTVDYVKLAGVPATVLSASSGEVIVQAGLPARLDSFSGDVEVRSDSGVISRYSSFTYDVVGRIDTVTPSAGQLGTTVTITGLRLGGGGSVSAVRFGDADATLIRKSDSEIVLQSGKNDVLGRTNITIVSSTGAQVIRVNGWEFVKPSTITGFSPSQGRYGTRVTISGSGLVDVTNVTLAGIPATEIEEYSNRVEARAGDGVEGMSGPVVVTSASGARAVTTQQFAYTKRGQVGALIPPEGVTATQVNISGNNFLGGGAKIVKATLGGIEALKIVSSSQSFVVVEAGFNDDGEPKDDVDLYLESDSGAITFSASAWSYLPSCKGNQFGNNTSNCRDCDRRCKRCFSFGNDNCRECLNFTDGNFCVDFCPKFADGSTCVDKCETFQYEKRVESANTTYCLPCDPLCDPRTGCFGGSASDCNACSEVSDDGVCRSECPVNKYADLDRKCQPCHSECEQGCKGPNPTDCVNCSHFSFTTFQGNSRVTECLAECDTNRFYRDGNQCLLCDNECRGGCAGTRNDQCDSCRTYQLGNQCVADCKQAGSYFATENGTCTPCNQFCNLNFSCTGPSNRECLQCATYSMYVNDELVCLASCPLNFYEESFECLPCSEQCTNGCKGPLPSQCISNGAFVAGVGTIAVFATVLVLLLVVAIVVPLCCWKKARKAGYSLSGGELYLHSTETNSERELGVKETRIDSAKRPTSSLELLEGEDGEEQYTDMGVSDELRYTDMGGHANVEPELYEDTEADNNRTKAPPPGAAAPATPTFRVPPPPPPEEEEMYESVDFRDDMKRPKSTVSASALPAKKKQTVPKSVSALPLKSGPSRPPAEPVPGLPPRGSQPQSPLSSVPTSPARDDAPLLPPRGSKPPEDAPMLPPRSSKPPAAPPLDEDLYEDCGVSQ